MHLVEVTGALDELLAESVVETLLGIFLLLDPECVLVLLLVEPGVLLFVLDFVFLESLVELC